MKIYLDLVFVINFLFDLILLSAVSIVLRRNVSIKRLLFGALIGSLSIFILFIDINNIQLFIFKFIISLIMTLIVFKYKDFRYTLRNLFYLYTISILLGGFLYFLNVQFSYKQDGLVFYFNGLSINVVVLIIISPIIIYTYVKQALELKNNYSNYYEVDLYLKDGTIKNLSAFLDTGNKLVDPYKKRPIILVEKKELKYDFSEYKTLFVPYDTVDSHGLMKCIVVDKVYIVGIGVKYDVLIGICKEKIKIDGVNCILHTALLEG